MKYKVLWKLVLHNSVMKKGINERDIYLNCIYIKYNINYFLITCINGIILQKL